MTARRPVVRVTIFDDQMNGALVALLETLNLAGVVIVHRNDMEGGASLDIPAPDFAQAFKLLENLQAWGLSAGLALSRGDQ